MHYFAQEMQACSLKSRSLWKLTQNTTVLYRDFPFLPRPLTRIVTLVRFSCFFLRFYISMLLSHLGIVLSINSILFTNYWYLLWKRRTQFSQTCPLHHPLVIYIFTPEQILLCFIFCYIPGSESVSLGLSSPVAQILRKDFFQYTGCRTKAWSWAPEEDLCLHHVDLNVSQSSTLCQWWPPVQNLFVLLSPESTVLQWWEPAVNPSVMWRTGGWAGV